MKALDYKSLNVNLAILVLAHYGVRILSDCESERDCHAESGIAKMGPEPIFCNAACDFAITIAHSEQYYRFVMLQSRSQSRSQSLSACVNNIRFVLRYVM